MGIFTTDHKQQERKAEEARQAEAAEAKPERRRSLFVSPKSRRDNASPDSTSTEHHKLTKQDHGDKHQHNNSKKGLFGTSLGAGHNSTSSSLPRTGSDVQAAPGSALALAREHLKKAHDAEEELSRALANAKQSSVDARKKVNELQDEALEELKAANAKNKEAKSLEKETRKLHH